MTNSPPPDLPPPQVPPPPPQRPPPAKEPGFLACAALVFVGILAIGTAASFVADVSGGAAWVGVAFGLSIVAGLIMLSIRDVRFLKCLMKGLVVNFAVFAVLAGVCLAALNDMYG